MGLFDLFAKKERKVTAAQGKAAITDITEEEKKYYKPDSYYTDVVNEGTTFEHKVITLEDRKKTAIPSNRGLYPAEVLLLAYCNKGAYPHPKYGYPGFWWFEYGIRDVGAALKSLEERGFIVFASVKDSAKSLTVQQLKELLVSKGCATKGKKADLVERVVEAIPDDELLAAGVQPKYVLTEIGQKELEENAYVPYMHNSYNKTIEDERLDMTFNVWSINKILGMGDKSNWEKVVEEQENKIKGDIIDNSENLMREIKRIDPVGYKIIEIQNQQIAKVFRAKDKYNEDKDIESYISFWEEIWENGGLKFEGSGWHFELAELYIKTKRYDDALAFVVKLKNMKPTYANKADTYIKRIEEYIARRVKEKKL